ncbi:unnamed protein product [Enterobius vermicularis]|uniref:Uncharacterized protein n=1 Tax=Enterobius vermicularis TaxID=51028 RepID=A0A0N4VIX0_ENTVE|nr:unnamed protein product [Enterobius vermicularis]
MSVCSTKYIRIRRWTVDDFSKNSGNCRCCCCCCCCCGGGGGGSSDGDGGDGGGGGGGGGGNDSAITATILSVKIKYDE